nr:MAG TPA: hypothetical protein [Caudoviricetes sp.]
MGRGVYFIFFFYFLSMFLVNKITCHRSTFI